MFHGTLTLQNTVKDAWNQSKRVRSLMLQSAKEATWLAIGLWLLVAGLSGLQALYAMGITPSAGFNTENKLILGLAMATIGGAVFIGQFIAKGKRQDNAADRAVDFLTSVLVVAVISGLVALGYELLTSSDSFMEPINRLVAANSVG